MRLSNSTISVSVSCIIHMSTTSLSSSLQGCSSPYHHSHMLGCISGLFWSGYSVSIQSLLISCMLSISDRHLGQMETWFISLQVHHLYTTSWRENQLDPTLLSLLYLLVAILSIDGVHEQHEGRGHHL